MIYQGLREYGGAKEICYVVSVAKIVRLTRSVFCLLMRFMTQDLQLSK